MNVEARLAAIRHTLEVKRQISDLLATLPAPEREAALWELLAVERSVTPPQEGHDVSPGYSDKILAALREAVALGVGEIAERVYGDSTPNTKNRARSLLTSLWKRGAVTKLEGGQWALATQLGSEPGADDTEGGSDVM